MFGVACYHIPFLMRKSNLIHKLVREGETGFFAPADAPEQWAEAVRRFEDDPDLRARIVAAADAEVRARYSWDIITDRLLDFYREVSRIHRRR